MSVNDPKPRVFDKYDEVEVTELFKKENLVKGATFKGTVVSSDPNYTEMITENGLISHIRTRYLRINKVNVFEVGDKVKTTKDHDKFFGSHEEGILEKIDGDYVDLYVQSGRLLTMHIKWIQTYKGDSIWFYKRKLV